jgi:endonuclease/exonuclease/phosphatase (EEP) superfamily protein YafD
MVSVIARIIVVLVVAAALAVLAWPQAFGLQNAWVVAHAVSFRGLAVVVAALLVAVLVLVLLLVREGRGTTVVLVALLVVFGAVNAGVLLHRGLGPADGAAPGADVEGSITVLSWNTLGDEPGAENIAELALAEGADVITLPETTEETGVLVAEAMRAAGRPMWVHTLAFDLISKARSTTVLISPELGDYSVTSAEGSGPPGNTNVLPTVVATPVDGDGPTIVAVHAVAPIQWEMSNWRSDLDWLAEQCGGDGAGGGTGGTGGTGGNVIMAGDFNATLDHFAGRAANDTAQLGGCRDAALLAGSAGVGTWPTWAPGLLGSPIDHVLATPNWQAESVRVISTEDTAGSDHRPIVATLSPAP